MRYVCATYALRMLTYALRLGTCTYPDEDSLAVVDREGAQTAASGRTAVRRFTFDRMYTPKATQVMPTYADVC
jgi:hypothetical protein